mgnify:CR=1 FL=1
MGIKVIIKSDIKKRVDAVAKMYAVKQNRWVDKTGSYFRNEIALGMRNSPATGKVYREGTAKEHIASSVGNPPRVDTSMLWSSIQYKRIRQGIGIVSTNIEYSERLEKNLKRYFMGKQSNAYRNTKIFGKMFAKQLGLK